MITSLLSLALAAATCAATDVGLPLPLTGWADARPAATVMIDRPVRLTLTAMPGAAKGDLGVTAVFEGARAGRYEVALSQSAWIDVIGGGHALASVSHRHGPDCSTIRKIVAFDLTPGRYTLRLTHSAKPSVTVAVYRAG